MHTCINSFPQDGYPYPCKVSSGCPCSRIENCKTQNVVLDSLEEVVINDHGYVDNKAELVRLWCRCSTRFHKKVAITVLQSGRTDDLRNKILSICPPNNKTEITIQHCTWTGALGPYHTVVCESDLHIFFLAQLATVSSSLVVALFMHRSITIYRAVFSSSSFQNN
jgi:hypothetical protein